MGRVFAAIPRSTRYTSPGLVVIHGIQGGLPHGRGQQDISVVSREPQIEGQSSMQTDLVQEYSNRFSRGQSQFTKNLFRITLELFVYPGADVCVFIGHIRM